MARAPKKPGIEIVEQTGVTAQEMDLVPQQSQEEADESRVVDLLEQVIPTVYTIRLAAKTPSQLVQFRMLEADVTVSGPNPDVALEEARTRLVMAMATQCVTWGETPPPDLRATLEEIYEPADIAMMYGELQQ